jgi:hypothetical protein
MGLEYLIRAGTFPDGPEWREVEGEVRSAVECVDWPPGSGKFLIYPESGKKRGMGNGVVPIKKNCINRLREKGWVPEQDDIDMSKELPDGRRFTLEWETGNISSSHRAVNKMVRGMLRGQYAGGILVLPNRNLAQYLTDRIGNYEELVDYFEYWGASPVKDGVLAVMSIEQDGTSLNVPKISKGKDGRAKE